VQLYTIICIFFTIILSSLEGIMTKAELRAALIESLSTQGFSLNGSVLPASFQKSHFKKIQLHSKKEQLKLQGDYIQAVTDTVTSFVRDGKTINPAAIKLELRLIEPDTVEEAIYRWWNVVWWSVPYQKAYGRQMRMLLWDTTHKAPFGLIGLQSPVLKMAVRDRYLNIPSENLDVIINKSMQAQRLGALPPYNTLLGGKMAAMSLTSNELRKLYQYKYAGVTTVMNKRILDPDLIFLTTTSAFGRSSIYNRLKYKDQLIAKSLGYTQGSGTFHVSHELYLELQKFLKRRKINVNTSFGYGPSRKVKLIDLGFDLLELSEYHYHNLHREFFLFPTTLNLEQVISLNEKPVYFDRPLDDLLSFWKQRWALPRSERDNSWDSFNARNFIRSSKANITRWTK
jgi:hypothetical protein